jgi:hypothetical protein
MSLSSSSSSSSSLSNWDLIVSFLHPSGENYNSLPLDLEKAVRRTADGFGQITGLCSNSIELLFDWSHIRDSSEKAINRMAYLIRECA